MTEKELLQKVIDLLSNEPKLRNRYESDITLFEQQLIQLKLDRYRIGVIGVTSSGKSTMINAILGDELLSMAVKPSSSQLVTCSKSSEKKATVYFEDKLPAEYKGKALTPKIIQKYSDENYNQKNREKVKQLELSTPKFAFSDEILLVDSPGLDAFGLEGHERLTLTSLLPTIDFCIFVTTLKTNSDEKMRSVLNIIAEYKCPVIIVQNMLDSVMPSPDGKKSSIDVANEHKLRVERIINHSQIADKSSVKIVQISSKLALQGRLENDSRKLDESNYNKLVNSVQATLNCIKPRIEANRINAVRERLNTLISEAKQDISPDASDKKSLKFEFEGLDTKLRKEADKTNTNLADAIGILGVQLKNIREMQSTDKSFSDKRSKLSVEVTVLRNLITSFTGKNKFSEDDIEKIRFLVKQCENTLLNEINNLNKCISDACQKLGIEERMLRTVESFGNIPGLRVHTKQEPIRVPKKGFGNKIARWLGGVFDTDWGYEYSTTTVFDEQATRQSAIKYLTTVIESYSSTCDKWSDSSATIINELCGHISVRRDAFQARQVEIADERAMMNVIENLEALITSIKDVKISKNNYVPHTETDLEIKLSNIKVSHAALAVYELAERVRQNIHKLTARHAGIGDGDINIVISWDALCTAMLLKNYFGITVSDEKLENGLTRFDNIVVIGKPSKELLESTAAEYSDRNVNWLVMFNAIQYGAALNAMHRSGLPEFIQKNDRLFLIVQDFRELCNADGVKDGLDNMKNVCRELNIESTPLILLNDNNPIYSLAAVQVQHTRCETHMDEVNLMNFIQDHFPYLLDPMAERTIHNIIQSL